MPAPIGNKTKKASASKPSATSARLPTRRASVPPRRDPGDGDREPNQEQAAGQRQHAREVAPLRLVDNHVREMHRAGGRDQHPRQKSSSARSPGRGRG
jgi:hypothetical protein